MSDDKEIKKERNRDRLELLRNETLTTTYYFKKTLYSFSTGALIGFGHAYFSQGSTLPNWVSLLAGTVAAAAYFVLSHMQTLRQINSDVKEWIRWSDSNV